MREFTKSERAYNFSYSNEAINKGNLKLLDKLLNICTKATLLLNSNKLDTFQTFFKQASGRDKSSVENKFNFLKNFDDSS
jgi:hypothetical protein